jgi:uncharacterized protein (TIGR03086 family)
LHHQLRNGLRKLSLDIAYTGHPLELLVRVLGVMRATVAGIDNSEWQRTTALEPFTVHALLAHVVNGIEQLSCLIEGAELDTEAVVDFAPEAALAQFDATAHRALELWGTAGALGTQYPMPWGPEEGERLAAYLVIEVVGHAWDLATALGTTLPISEELAGQVLEVAQSFSEETLRDPGMFGPKVVAEPGSGPLTELISFLGRTA